jgi:hypothetical protein
LLPFAPPSLSADKKRFLKLFDQLGPKDRETLEAFAEFLLTRAAATDGVGGAPQLMEPKGLPRPQDESVVAAIKRLSDDYAMLDRQDMLSETASLMSAHVLQGRTAPDVIDELEVIFKAHYERYLEKQSV